MGKIDFQPIADNKIDFRPQDSAEPSVAAIGSPDPENQAPKTSAANAALQGFGQGASMGYLPQLRAAAQNVTDPLFSMMTGNKVDPESYTKARDDASKEMKMLDKEHPLAYGGGSAAGALASALAVPLPGGAAKTLMGKIGQGALTGAGLGVLSNPGDKEGQKEEDTDHFQMLDRLKNGAFSGIVGGSLPIVGKLAENSIPVLKKLAATAAFKSLGPYAADIKKAIQNKDVKLLEEMGVDPEMALSGKGVQGIGQTAIDEGVVGGIPKKYDTMANLAESKKKEVGKKLGAYIQKLQGKSNQLADEGYVPFGLSRKSVADEMRAQLTSPHTDIAGSAARNQAVEDAAKAFEEGQGAEIPLSDLNPKKTEVQNAINFERNPTPGGPVSPKETILRKQSALLTKGENDLARGIENNGGGTPGQFEKLKEHYGNLNTIKKIASKRNAHELAKIMGAGSFVGTVGGVAAGASKHDPLEMLKDGAIGALAGAGVGAGARMAPQLATNLFGNGATVAAPLMKKLSDLAAKNPWAANNILNAIKRSNANGQE